MTPLDGIVKALEGIIASCEAAMAQGDVWHIESNEKYADKKDRCTAQLEYYKGLREASNE